MIWNLETQNCLMKVKKILIKLMKLKVQILESLI